MTSPGAKRLSAAGGYVNSFRLPGTESQRAYDLLKDRFPQQSGDTASVVFAGNENWPGAKSMSWVLPKVRP